MLFRVRCETGVEADRGNRVLRGYAYAYIYSPGHGPMIEGPVHHYLSVHARKDAHWAMATVLIM